MSMVRVGPVRVSVRRSVVPVRVAVLALDRRLVNVIVMAVVVAMRVIVLELFVGVHVLVPLGEMQVQRRHEQTCSDRGERARRPIAQEPGRHRADEGSCCKNGARATRAHDALRSQVKPEA
jgi:hypothetical protein